MRVKCPLDRRTRVRVSSIIKVCTTRIYACSAFGLTVRCMAGGRCGLSAGHSWNDVLLRLRRDTCRIRRRRRTMTNATDAPAMTTIADNAPTSRPIRRWALLIWPVSLFFVCCGKPATRREVRMSILLSDEIAVREYDYRKG